MKTDVRLVEEVKEGDTAAFAELVSRHQKGLLRMVVRVTRDLYIAEDVVQDSFLKAYRKIGSFEGRSSFRNWLYQIGLNTARNRLRTLHRESLELKESIMAEGPKAESLLLANHLRAIVKSEVDALPLRQRTALTLRIFEDMSFKEIAEIMQCPYDTAKANYRHALMKLRHRFNEKLALDASEMEVLKVPLAQVMTEVDA
jgi:RNA polymerase sigma-70 factor (ECF subfamily)